MVVPTIAVTPAVQAFDTVKVGKQSPPQTFTITNLGGTDLVIGTINVTGAETSEFRLQHDGCSEQMVAPAGTCLLEVLFAPTSTGAKTATLQIPSTDPETPLLEVLLTGMGVKTGVRPPSKTTPSASNALTIRVQEAM
jgi:Abnormal spindle-like microcephaly-assoc'd, ASPM-SPD-2-Hydin